MKKVKFIKKYAGKEVDDEMKCNSILAHNLVKKHRVAEYVIEELDGTKPKAKFKAKLIKVKFTKPFAEKKKGNIGEYNGMLANRLVNVRKIAEYVTEKSEAEIEADKVKADAKAKAKADKAEAKKVKDAKKAADKLKKK